MRRACWFLLLLLPLLLGAPACHDDRPPPATTGEFGQRTPAYLGGLIPVIDVNAADQTGLKFIVDTGSPVTLLNSVSFGHDQDYSAAGTTDLQAFNLGFTAIPTVTYAAFGADACGDVTLAGIVGGDLLQFYALTVDYLGAALFLWDDLGGSPDIGQAVAPATSVKVHLKGGGRANVVGLTVDLPPTRLVVDGSLEEQDGSFLVDTGASMVTMPQRVFDTLGSQDRPRIADVPVQTVYGESKGFIIRLRGLSLGGATQTDVPTFVVPDATLFNDLSSEVHTTIVALVGGTFLRNYQTTIRYPADRIELAAYHDPVHVNPREFVGPGFDLAAGCDGGFFVARVFPGTSAADQGIAEGSELLSIDTQQLAGLTIDEVDRLMRSYDAGAEVVMALRSGFAVRTFTFTYSDLLPRFTQ
ncbi:MAG: aspartyl protease family protein [Deltaproteobacteria bacterium]|nr:aspartyl protease family protein [Deltaproteobacteria bacterium]